MKWMIVLAILSVTLQFTPAVTAVTVSCVTCVCTAGTVNCRGVGLTTLPTFDSSLQHFTRIDLSNNSFTHIPTNAFRNLQAQSIDLSYSNIASIDSHAFGLISNLTSLNLRGNNLTALPSALRDLPRLQILDVSENPIPDRSFERGVMTVLGGSLREFHFGHKTVLMRWPETTSHLQRLEILDVNGMGVYNIFPQNFHGFENRLRKLTIQYTNLLATPLLNTLRVLEELHLDHNNFGDYGVQESSFVGLNNLHTLSLKYDKLTKFPAILRNVPNLLNLNLDGNRFYYISDDAVNILIKTRIQNLSLENCGLDRVPGSIAGRNLNHLRSLNLAKNNIISIERNDLDGLSNLVNVSFANNPLRYISTQSLNNLTSLINLDMSRTSLTIVPEALKNLPNLGNINFIGDNIECNCNLVEFQKLQRNRGFSVLGTCETIERTITEYLRDFIPKCPDYI